MQYATYRVADVARNDFYTFNKQVSVDILGRQLGSATREREEEQKRSKMTRPDTIKIFTALFRYNATKCTRLLKRRKRESKDSSNGKLIYLRDFESKNKTIQ